MGTTTVRIWNQSGQGYTATMAVNGSFLVEGLMARWNEISPQVDFSLPLSWMKFCRDSHETCNAIRGPQMEKVLSLLRLIDCERTLSRGELHVISPVEFPPYAALSYVWGRELDDGSGEQAKSECRTGKPSYACHCGETPGLPTVLASIVLAL